MRLTDKRLERKSDDVNCSWCPHAARLVAGLTVIIWLAAYGPASHSASIQNYRLHNFEVGGAFVLTDQFGARKSLADFTGHVVVLFFGFTNCPDVCPTTMAEMGIVLGSLREREMSARIVFITVDPERDTPEKLKSYLASFDESIIGLTGTEEEITEVVNQFNTRFQKQIASEGSLYSVDHTSFIYILDQQGQARFVVPADIGSKMIVEGVLSLLEAEG